METRELKAKIAELEGDSSILREQRNEAEDKLKESRKLSIDKVAKILSKTIVTEWESCSDGVKKLHLTYYTKIAKAIVESNDLWEG